MKGWIISGCESAYQQKQETFFSAVKKREQVGEKQKCLQTWPGGSWAKKHYWSSQKRISQDLPLHGKAVPPGVPHLCQKFFLHPPSLCVLLSRVGCRGMLDKINSLAQVAKHSSPSSSVRWGSSFWSSYQMLNLEALVLLNKYIFKMQSVFVLHMLLVLKVNRLHVDNRKSLNHGFLISFHFCSHYTNIEVSPRIFQ